VIAGLTMAAATMAAQSASNDPLFDKQYYLKQIRIPAAWDWIGKRELTPVTVAIVDTGVDLSHPDLKDRIVSGTNILTPSQPPQDDSGHGTNVAGIIAAVTNNGEGIAGIAPNARIMPIKAIASSGLGQEEHLGQGIRYAVDNGADIVVLSLGLHLYSSYLSNIVAYAESKGVLMVAATGNLGESVMYPAAYPSVIAVGGASLTNAYKSMSNFGPEVDLMAPWYVYTTTMGGGYAYKEGTSMAAPQVTAVAALMLGLNPDLKPSDIRERLRQTAFSSQRRWNPYEGYGLLRADTAISIQPKSDMFEPNNNRSNAAFVSSIGLLQGELESASDEDWFTFEPPYPGDVSLRITGKDGQALPIELLMDQGEDKPLLRFDISSNPSIRLRTTDRKLMIGLKFVPQAGKALPPRISYVMESNFHIYIDAYEPNDRTYQSFLLADRSGVATGTFHQLDDQDWYAMKFTVPGTLRLRVDTDTPRVDPELLVYSETDGTQNVYDDASDGESEFSDPIQVKPGTYYFRVRNVKDRYAQPVVGEYQLRYQYERKYTDDFEPNNYSFQATTITFDRALNGVFHSAQDKDWYQFRLTRKSVIDVDLSNIPFNRMMTYTIFSSSTKPLFVRSSDFGTTDLRSSHELNPGVYYVRLTTDVSFQDQQYRLKFNRATLIAGYRDIELHWARDAIERLTALNVVQGYGNFQFLPNQNVTRAEAAIMVARAYGLKPLNSTTSFPDVTKEHWASGWIFRLVKNGGVRGYPDGMFRPDALITRAEMTTLVAWAAKIKGVPKKRLNSRFIDVPNDLWAAPAIQAFAEAKQVNGFKDGTFRPNDSATRAEFTSFLSRVLK
jgi:hypothetical protein